MATTYNWKSQAPATQAGRSKVPPPASEEEALANATNTSPSGWEWAGSAAGKVGGVAGGMIDPFGIVTGRGIVADYLGRGQNKAAEGAGIASQGFSALGQQQWDLQQQGLDKILALYGRGQGYYDNTYGSQGPGAAEQFYSNYSPFSNQSQISQVLGNYGNYMQQPLETRNAQYGASREMTRGGQGYWGATAGKSFGQPGTYEDWYQRNQGQFNAPSQAMQAYDLYGGQLAGPGRSEGMNVEGRFDNRLGNFVSSLPALQGAHRTDEAAGEVGGYIRGANQPSQYYQSQAGALQGPGVYENFVAQDIYGNNPAMERAKTQGLAKINQELARRGAFNSGSADTQIGNFLGEMEAREYDARAQRAQQAQQMQLGRIGQGTQTAQAAAQGGLAQGGALQGLAEARSRESLARTGQRLQGEQAVSGETLSQTNQLLQQAQQADAAKLARLQGLSSMAQAGDRGAMDRLALAQGAAKDAQASELSRILGGIQSSRGLDQDSLARAAQMFEMGQGIDAGELARYGLQGKFAGQQDELDLARYLGMGGMAQNAQAAQTQRQKDAFSALMQLLSGQAGATEGAYTRGTEQYGNAQSAALNALMAMYGYQGEALNAVPKLAMAAGEAYLRSQGGG